MIHRLSLNVRLFFQGALLSYIALFHWLRPAQYLATKVWGPLVYMLFFVFLGRFATGRDNADFYVIGNAIQTVALSGIYGVTMSIDGDRWGGTLPYLFGAPANRLTVFVGRSFFHIVDGVVGALIGLTWGVLLLGLDLSKTDPLALALTILVATFSTSGLGLLLGCMGLITRNVMFINNTVFFLLLVFSGANVDIQALPAWGQAVSQALPLTRGIAAARRAIAGESLSQVAPLLVVEFSIGVIYVALGYTLFRWFEIQAKRRGTLEAM
ncbi:MAG: ABC transporter permease [Anaerolineales bacterium]|nr:ABC transporter permease [Anaerolineales bacterium]